MPSAFPLLPLLLMSLLACGHPLAEERATGDLRTESQRLALTTCEVPGSSAVVRLAATRDGVVFAVAGSEGKGIELERHAGLGCDLHRDRSPQVAVGALLDADDHGNLYAFPRASSAPGVVSTLLEKGSAEGMVVKVDASGQVSKLVSAGRGIWSFGVSAEGGSFWVTSCGPTGIFSTASQPLEPAIESPQTLWAQRPSVLTGDRTLWSVGVRTCGWDEKLSPSCGFALVRTTSEGSRDVGTTVVDVGAGFEEAKLARCGKQVCGILSSAVLVWDDGGRVVQTIRPSDFPMFDSERIAQISGNAHGVYFLLDGRAGTRVVFVPFDA